MTIASAIQAKQQQVADSYTAVSNKGGTLPTTQNLTNLATAISSIPSGGSATLITKSITANGTYNASSDNADGYSSVTVNVEDIGITREVLNGVYQIPTNNFDFVLSDEADTLDYNALRYAFYQCSGLVNFNLKNITTIRANGIAYACYACPNLINANLSNVITVGNYGIQYAFADCSSLSTVNVSNIKTIGEYGAQYAFRGTALVNVDFQSLNSLAFQALTHSFDNCQRIANIYFRALTTSSFGSYKNQFNYMMGGTGTTTTHTIHFPSNLQSTISGLTGYPLFGGTSGYVTLSFDLPATS